MYLLWSINPEAALPVAVVTGVLAFLLALTSVMPLLQSALGWVLPQTLAIPQCPYKSPISWAIHRSCVSLVVIFSFPFGWLKRLKCAKADLSQWRKRQLKLLPDFLWQEYDELWRQQRERWGPQSSKAGYKGVSYYLVHSLASAMEALMFGNAVHIIHACLQDFHGTEAEVETFRGLFSEDFPPVEVDLLQDARVPPTTANRTAATPSSSKHVHLRRDFLNALALQYFVKHNQKLRLTALSSTFASKTLRAVTTRILALRVRFLIKPRKEKPDLSAALLRVLFRVCRTPKDYLQVGVIVRS